MLKTSSKKVPEEELEMMSEGGNGAKVCQIICRRRQVEEKGRNGRERKERERTYFSPKDLYVT